ncbi:MAG: radical SAM protein [Thermoplasmata archaeon]
MKARRDERLGRYERIAAGHEPPRYLLTKKIECRFDASDASEKLWELHNDRCSGIGTADHARKNTSLLDLKVELAERVLSDCIFCERRCGANRAKGEKGACGVLESRVSSEFIHMGEEPEIIPSYTIFFSGCTFKCVFCQNWDISTNPDGGRMIPPEKLARMIEGRDASLGCESDRLKSIAMPAFLTRANYAKNVNWVGGDPTSNIPFVLKTLQSCNSRLPQVWNSNMYLTEESMRLLDGVIDLYLTDFKYGNDGCAKRLSGIDNYFDIVSRNHLLAARQCDVLVRHLVMPNHIDCCTKPVLEWVAENMPDAVVNVMAQYRPEHRAYEFDDISRPISPREYAVAIKIAENLGLNLTS